MKLEVGMYVRTNEGLIFKIYKVVKSRNVVIADYSVFDDYELKTDEIDIKDLLCYEPKISFNKVDLIEVGDYVNGYLVAEIGLSVESRKYVTTTAYHKINYGNVFEDDIESVVTREQFKNCEYKFEEE